MSKKLPGLLVTTIFLTACFGGGSTLENGVVESDHLTAQIPEGWHVVDQSLEEGDWLYIEGEDGGIHNITVFNLEFFVGIPNAETVKKYTPLQLLEASFESISTEVATIPESPWKNFELNETPVAGKFKELDSAQGSFSVDEFVPALQATQRRQLRRVLLFVGDEVVLVVFSVPAEDFEQRVGEFGQFLDGLEFK